MLGKITNIRRIFAPTGQKNQSGLTHSSMREEHFRREQEELCRQLRHQQYFYGYRTKCS